MADRVGKYGVDAARELAAAQATKDCKKRLRHLRDAERDLGAGYEAAASESSAARLYQLGGQLLREWHKTIDKCVVDGDVGLDGAKRRRRRK